MLVRVLESFRKKSDGTIVQAGEVLDIPEAKANVLIEKGRACPAEGSIARWGSPVFGKLSAPLLELREKTFVLRHPITNEVVELSRDWLVSLYERSAILEYDGSLPREEADRQARRDIFNLFRKGEKQ
ncbi:hypothetical protein [Leptospirillum ferriphilum]|uniref:hypothetical protein n=1 Tax=Leptospirillum ferriphilum TaxID=178606 RepID=UPI0006B2124C|nr:hypothetical protein [Leptospirillum ferriphilum]